MNSNNSLPKKIAYIFSILILGKEHKFDREAEPVPDELLEMLTHDGKANDSDDEEESIFRQSLNS